MFSLQEIFYALCVHISDDLKKSFNFQQKINHIKTDSRKVNKDDLFIAIAGDVHDGHNFINNAIESGAIMIIGMLDEIELKKKQLNNWQTSVLISEKYASVWIFSCLFGQLKREVIYIQIADSTKAYGQIAHYYRSHYLAETYILGVTGSVGKTTLKNLLSFALEQISGQSIYGSYGNFNNFIGVAWNILQIKPGTKFAVIEMGMNKSGEIAWLSWVTQPDLAIICSVSASHLAGFSLQNSCESIAGELFGNFSAQVNDLSCEVMWDCCQKIQNLLAGKYSLVNSIQALRNADQLKDDCLVHSLTKDKSDYLINSLSQQELEKKSENLNLNISEADLSKITSFKESLNFTQFGGVDLSEECNDFDKSLLNNCLLNKLKNYNFDQKNSTQIVQQEYLQILKKIALAKAEIICGLRVNKNNNDENNLPHQQVRLIINQQAAFLAEILSLTGSIEGKNLANIEYSQNSDNYYVKKNNNSFSECINTVGYDNCISGNNQDAIRFDINLLSQSIIENHNIKFKSECGLVLLYDPEVEEFWKKNPQLLEKIFPYPNLAWQKTFIAGLNILLAMGFAYEQIIRALSDFFIQYCQNGELLKGRGYLNMVEHNKLMLIDDTYNAGFEAMQSAMQNLISIDKLSNFNHKRKVAILGEMKELGKYATYLHGQLLPLISAQEIDLIIIIGQQQAWKMIIDEFSHKNNLKFYENVEDFIADLSVASFSKQQSLLHEGDLVLLKGANSVGLLKVVEWLEKNKINSNAY